MILWPYLLYSLFPAYLDLKDDPFVHIVYDLCPYEDEVQNHVDEHEYDAEPADEHYEWAVSLPNKEEE